MKKRKIYIGDPCYVFNNDTEEGTKAWRDYIYQEDLKKPYKLEGDIEIASCGTANGDGFYEGKNTLTNKKADFPVDAGLIGYVDLTNIKKGDPRFVDFEYLEEEHRPLGVIQETTSTSIYLAYSNGTVFVGDWEIETDPVEDEEEYEWDDGDDEDDDEDLF